MSILKILVIPCFKRRICTMKPHAYWLTVHQSQDVSQRHLSFVRCSPDGLLGMLTSRWRDFRHSSHTHLLYCACSAQIHKHISSVVELHHYVPLDHCLLFLPVHTETVPVFMMHHKLLAAAYILDVEVLSLISLRCNCIRFNFPSLNPVYVVRLLK